ncbi:hypothetical protein [Actinomadura fibrosa]|uniref:Uncharacterized protein n=1 Tax=Actinomadura fibrosa TaxID=111802 RepID=A0ABW2XE33_9ACTN|nr:hypothetical protein [Actinomadura fibrosa]
MYALIWRLLPGSRPTKIALAAVLVLVAAVVLWYLVFPWLEPKVQFDHGVVDGGRTGAPSGGPSTAPPG